MSETEQIENIIKTVLGEMNLELVDFVITGGGGKKILRIFVYEKGGVLLDRCVQASRKISEQLDLLDPISSNFVLEVSSPGLDRPLISKRDFERNIGEKIKAILNTEDKNNTIVGHITHIKDDTIFLEDNGQTREFNLAQLKSAKIIIEF